MSGARADQAVQPSPVMTADEVAQFLKIPRWMVYDYAKRGVLPVVRLGRQLRFSRKKIEALFE